MKRILLLFCLLTGTFVFSQVVANQVDDFQDGTTQSWRIGNAAGASDMPMNISDAGPTGDGDNCLQYTSVGGGGVASKMVIYTQNLQWSGDFLSENIGNIDMDVRVQTNDLNLRIALQGSDGTRICSTNSVAVSANGTWTSIGIPISAADFTVLSGSGNATSVLTDVVTLRLLSSNTPTWAGADVVASILQVDNITASPVLSTTDFETQNNDFVISPNPAKSKLNIKLANADGDTKLEVFDVLGKRVYKGALTSLNSSVNVSNWKSGIYLVRVSNNKAIQTKRFIKQ
jgi:hypothetical protein